MVVTGIAMTTALATTAEDTWKKLLDRQSGIRKLEDPFVEQYDLPVRIGGHLLEDFDYEPSRLDPRRASYLQKMSTALGRRVWENAGSPEVDPKRLMVSIGTGMGSTEELVFSYDDMRAGGMTAVSPIAVQKYMPSAVAAAVGLQRRAKGAVMTPVSACASGAEGIAHAWRDIVLGDADVAICGGVETKIEAVPMAGFAKMRIVLSTTNDNPAGACRPFDRDRNGFVFGEAGALMVVETEQHAKARGATILARLMGAGITSDGYHIVAPDPNGEQAGYAMTRAIQLAGGLAPPTSTTSTRMPPVPPWATWLKARQSTTRWAGTSLPSTPPRRPSAIRSARSVRSRPYSRYWRCATGSSRPHSTWSTSIPRLIST